MAEANLFFKCENFQKMGAFKMRGATNAILSLSPEQKKAGVVTHSSGNFGQAVALAAANLGVSAYIVMPSNAPRVKVEGVKQYGGKITFCEPTIEAREEAAAIIENQGATFLHPSNQIEVILGNATAAIELLQDYPDLDILVAPVGGGGLIAGTALAAYHFGQNCETIGAEPAAVDDAWRSLRSGRIEKNETTNTIADGLRTTLGDVNFPIIRELVGDIIRVEEEEIVQALRLIWERLKIVVEPSCAVALAAVLKAPEHFKGKRVGLIISGGNVDLNSLPF
jgi:threonine dehydratase